MSQYTTHKNSKKVTIFRKPGGTQAQSDLKEYYALTSQSMGSYFQGGGSQKSASGMAFWEEAILMPLLIDVPEHDKEFRKKVASFNDDINTTVPYFLGRELEIGMLQDNDKGLEDISIENPKGNFPIAPLDYLRYRHAQGHPECSNSKEEAMSNMLKLYYIHDSTRENNTAFVDLEEKDNALTSYLGLKSDPKKVEMHLSLLGRDTRGILFKEQLSLLRLLVEEKSAAFLENVADKDNLQRYFINQLLAARVLDLVGSSYLVKESGEALGYSIAEVVEYLKNKSNSQMVGVLKAQLQEVRKPKAVTEDTEVA